MVKTWFLSWQVIVELLTLEYGIAEVNHAERHGLL